MSSEEVNQVERRVDCIEMHNRVRSLEYWRDGNGAKGAEERLQSIEKKVTAILILMGITVGQDVLKIILSYL